MNLCIRSALLLVLALGITAPPEAAGGEEASLAERCNAIPWKTELGSSDHFPRALRALQRELEAAGPEVVAAVAEGLPSSLNLRRIAPRVLERHPSDKVRTLLVELLTDPDDRTAEAAANALGEVGGVEVIPPLRRAVIGERPMVTHNALGALISLGAADRSAHEAQAALRHPDSFVRTTALQLIAEIRGEASLAQAHEAVTALEKRETSAEVLRYAKRTQAILAARRE